MHEAKKGFWVYLATNARLLRPDVIPDDLRA